MPATAKLKPRPYVLGSSCVLVAGGERERERARANEGRLLPASVVVDIYK
jgi:hypothetical protein